MLALPAILSDLLGVEFVHWQSQSTNPTLDCDPPLGEAELRCTFQCTLLVHKPHLIGNILNESHSVATWLRKLWRAIVQLFTLTCRERNRSASQNTCHAGYDTCPLTSPAC